MRMIYAHISSTAPTTAVDFAAAVQRAEREEEQTAGEGGVGVPMSGGVVRRDEEASRRSLMQRCLAVGRM